MSDRLLPCPACARHVRSSEGACPFCATTLPTLPAAQPLPRSAGTRLSRAALFALGASAAAAAACGGETNAVPMYGAPGVVADADRDTPQLAPVYGAPPDDAGKRDAPSDSADAASDAGADAGDAGDAAPDAEGGTPAPLYGAPPF